MNLFKRAKLKAVSKLFPIPQVKVTLLDDLEIGFAKPQLNRLERVFLSVPQISENYCPEEPCIEDFLSPIDETETVDLTHWFSDRLDVPDIYSFPLALPTPKSVGKTYDLVIGGREQQFTFSSKTDGQLKQIQKERLQKKSPVDIFDLLLPVLQPPLAEDFENYLVFPEGKELLPFQRPGTKFLVEHKQALLGDEMGLGKSIQTIAALKCLLRRGEVANALIVCPKSVLIDWEKKVAAWAPEIKLVKVRGSREDRQLRWNFPAHIYLTTYDTVKQDVEGNIARKTFDAVVLDEIQYLKNPGTERTKAIHKMEAQIRWGLSGTPLENRIEEVISIFSYLRPGLLHKRDAERPGRVKEAIRPYFLRRRKAEAISLPEKFSEEAWLELAPAQRAAYDIAEKQGIVALNEKGESVTVQHILALITKLKQLCNRDPVTGESCKLEFLKDKLEKLSEQNDKALIFSQYPSKTLSHIEQELQEFSPLLYHGGLSDSGRQGIIDSFQEKDDSRVLLMSLKAGGLGLTLTRANYVYHFDLWWNPAAALQAEDRTHRIGQKKTVFVTSILTVDTIEEKIQNIINRKKALFKEIVDDLSDTDLSKILTEEELFGLFNLKKPRYKNIKNVEQAGPALKS